MVSHFLNASVGHPWYFVAVTEVPFCCWSKDRVCVAVLNIVIVRIICFISYVWYLEKMMFTHSAEIQVLAYFRFQVIYFLISKIAQ